MRLYLTRHGDALSALNDQQRSLSTLGIQTIEKLRQFFLQNQIRIAEIFHSPKVRAQQTAHILSEILANSNQLHILEELMPDVSSQTMMPILEALTTDSLLVGHLPQIAQLTANLLGTKTIPFLFEPGSTVCLEKVGYELWAVIWFLDPHLL